MRFDKRTFLDILVHRQYDIKMLHKWYEFPFCQLSIAGSYPELQHRLVVPQVQIYDCVSKPHLLLAVAMYPRRCPRLGLD